MFAITSFNHLVINTIRLIIDITIYLYSLDNMLIIDQTLQLGKSGLPLLTDMDGIGKLTNSPFILGNSRVYSDYILFILYIE